MVSLDGGELYEHGREGRVAPLMAEDYGVGDATASYWGVAVVRSKKRARFRPVGKSHITGSLVFFV